MWSASLSVHVFRRNALLVRFMPEKDVYSSANRSFFTGPGRFTPIRLRTVEAFLSSHSLPHWAMSLSLPHVTVNHKGSWWPVISMAAATPACGPTFPINISHFSSGSWPFSFLASSAIHSKQCPFPGIGSRGISVYISILLSRPGNSF